MSTSNLAADGKKKHKSRGKSAKDFHGSGVVEGVVPIPNDVEVDIQNAREVLDSRSKKNLGKPYKVKVTGTDTSLIIKRKSVMRSAPREQTLLCNEIYRFFIFVRDPKLVILVVPNKQNEKRAYLLLKMKDENQANQVCNVIQNGRKRLSANSVLQSKPKIEETPEMQENGTPVDKPASYLETKEEEDTSGKSSPASSPEMPRKSVSSRTSSHETVEVMPQVAEGKEASTALRAGDSRSESASSRNTSEKSLSESISKNLSQYSLQDTSLKQQPEIESSTSKTPTPIPPKPKKQPEEPIRVSSNMNVESAAPMYYESDSSGEDHSAPRWLPRQPLKDGHRRRKHAPVIEEMEFKVPANWKPIKPKQLFKGDDLREALLRDMYDKDWAVDVKIIENVGDFGSRISENGNVYMFTAHHLIPENYCNIECITSSSSSSEEEEVEEKDERFSPHLKSKKASEKPRKISHLMSSSSDEEEVREHPDYPSRAVYT